MNISLSDISSLFITQYRYYKNSIEEYDYSRINSCSEEEYESNKRAFTKMNDAFMQLEGHIKIIIEHEVIFHEGKDWYLNYFSLSTYNTYRKKAYEEYCKILNSLSI